MGGTDFTGTGGFRGAWVYRMARFIKERRKMCMNAAREEGAVFAASQVP